MLSGPGPDAHRARRDRHGRGMRGPLAPSSVPVSRSRSERFDDLVLDAIERLEHRFPDELADVEFAVEDVPDPPTGPDAAVPLGAARPAQPGLPGRIVLYRRPIEMRTPRPDELAELVRLILTDQVAELLGVPPEEIDPDD